MKKLPPVLKTALMGALAFQLILSSTLPSLAESSPVPVNNAVKETAVKNDEWYNAELSRLLEDQTIPLTSFIDNQNKGKENISIGEFIALLTKLRHPEGLNITSTDWLPHVTQKAIEDGLISKDEFSDYNAGITREKMAVLIERYLGSTEKPEYEFWYHTLARTHLLTDLDKKDSEGFYDDNKIEIAKKITRVYSLGIISGSPDGTFKQHNKVIRTDAYWIIKKLVFKELRNKPIFDFKGPKMKEIKYDFDKIKAVNLSGNICKFEASTNVQKYKYFLYKDFVKDFNLNIHDLDSDSYCSFDHRDMLKLGLGKGYVIDSKGYWHVVMPYDQAYSTAFAVSSLYSKEERHIKYMVVPLLASTNEDISKNVEYYIVIPVDVKFKAVKGYE